MYSGQTDKLLHTSIAATFNRYSSKVQECGGEILSMIILAQSLGVSSVLGLKNYIIFSKCGLIS